MVFPGNLSNCIDSLKIGVQFGKLMDFKLCSKLVNQGHLCSTKTTQKDTYVLKVNFLRLHGEPRDNSDLLVPVSVSKRPFLMEC